MKRIALRTTSGTSLIRYAQGSGGVEPGMNLRSQVNKFNDRALRARQQGDHSLADYFEHLRDHMLAEAEAGRPRPFSHYLPQVQEEFGEHISKIYTREELEDMLFGQGGMGFEDPAPPHSTWYHASPHDLPVGTTLVPGGAPAASKDFYDKGFGEDRGTLQDMGGGRAQHVWLTPDQEDAGFWSAVNQAPHIYEVEPHDEPRPWNGTGTDGWVTPAATIKRKVQGPKTSALSDEEREADLQRLMKEFSEERRRRHNTSSKIYRGLKLDFPPELEDHIKKYNQMPMEPEEVGQHLKIGPAILDHLERAHPRRENPFHEGDEDMGLGRHWTTNQRFAEIAAMQGGPYGARHGVVLEADHPGEDYLEHEHPAVGGSFQDSSGNPMTPWKEEEEYTLKPGTRVNVTGVKLNGNEVLHDPSYAKKMPKDYGIPYNGGPSQRLAVEIRHKIPSDLNWLDEHETYEPPHPWQSQENPDSTDETRSGKWYHVSPYELDPGTRLVPRGAPSPGGEGEHNYYTHEPSRGIQNRPNYVWMSPNLTKARSWRNWAGSQSHIYEVHPGDRPQPWNFNGNEGWVAPHATIKRKVDPKEYRHGGRPYTDEERAQHKQQGWRGPPCEDPTHQGEIMGRCPDCGRRVAPEEKVAYWDETPWLNAAWDEDLDDDEEEPVLPPTRRRRGR